MVILKATLRSESVRLIVCSITSFYIYFFLDSYIAIQCFVLILEREMLGLSKKKKKLLESDVAQHD
jgi:hypothetical protein